jgi:riboflavin transporter FmnP
MARIERPTVKIAAAALLAPLAILMQILPPLFLTPWSMRIDLVAVPWILCWIVFGLRTSLLCVLISAPLVGVLGPAAGGLVGMVMKSVASVWMFLIPAIFAHKVGGVQKLLENKLLFGLAVLGALIIRALVTVIFNFYFALPIFFGMSPDAILGFFTAWQSFVGKSFGLIGLGAYIAEIAFWNTVQGLIDVSVSSALGIIVLRRLAIKH